MLKWTTETGETRYLAVHALPAWGGGSQCDPADLIAALKANAAACGEVTAAMGWVTDQALAVTGERAEQAERSLATVTAERDAAKYWLAAHKAASEALVDPVTGHGFSMLIGKGDDGADGWFYTFGGPLDSYTLCERSDDQDPHFVYFQRERYDHDRGCWIDGCEVVEPVLAPDECSVAPYCLEDVTEERDALKRERDEARAERDAAVDRLVGARVARESAIEDAEALRAQLAKTARERDDAMTLAEERRDYARAQNAKLSVECDDLRAQLTAVERERDEAHAALRDCATRLENGSAVSPKASHAFHCAVATEVGIVVPALRAKLAKTERVVEAWGELSAVRRATMRETFPALHAAFVAAAFPPHTAQPYGHISKANECQIDSPVGVAATAEESPVSKLETTTTNPCACARMGFVLSHRQACEARLPRLEPGTAITRAELVSAVRSAASAVGGPPRRALDALAEALEIPRT